MKLFSSLKFQFIVIFSIFIIALILVTAILGIWRLRRSVEEAFALQGISIVERAASFIDGDSFEALVNSMDDTDPFYEETRVELLELKEASACLYLYTMAPVGGDIYQDDWIFIIDGSSEMDDEFFSFLGDEEDTSDYDDAFRRLLVSGETETSRLVDQGEWGWLISAYAAIKNSAGKIVGIVGCDFDGEPLYKAVRQGQNQNIIIGAVSIAVGLALLLLFLRLIFSRLNHINKILHEISLGEGDLTKQIKIDRDDEIGKLSNYFNMTLEKIRNLIVAIKGEASKLHDIGNDLASNMEKTASTVSDIATNTKNIKDLILNQGTSVNETNSTMELLVQNINKLNGHIENQTSNITQASSAIEQMVANTRSVTETLVKNTDNVKNLKEASEVGHSGLNEVAQDIQEIARESEGLLEINAVMKNIASQTNLLSMNAAIEAAHAGEAGKGFAVVADEIRKLAENSSEQSKTIGGILKKIKNSIDKITSSTKNVLNRFEAIDSNIKIVAQQEENIRNAMEEQGIGSKQILEGVSNVNEISRLVKNASAEMLTGAEEVIREAGNLEKSTKETSGGMNKMSSGAEQINAAVNLVNEISIKTREHIEILFDEVSKFKV